MLPLDFFGQNIHFAISLFAALVFFAVFWLEFDAWLTRRDLKDLVKWLGYIFIALSFVTGAVITDRSITGASSTNNVLDALTYILRGLGFIGVILGQLLDPLQKVPMSVGLSEDQFQKSTPDAPVVETVTLDRAETAIRGTKKSTIKKQHAITAGGFPVVSQSLVVFGALTIAVLYWRRATTGLERHYKPVAYAFGLLCIYELLSMASLLHDSTSPVVAQAVAAYGPIWIVARLFLLASSVILGFWVWKYLTRRFMSQLFMILTALTLTIFLLTTISFTYLLVSNIKKSSLDNLQTASGVLSYAVDSKKSEITARTQSIADNAGIKSGMASGDTKALAVAAQAILQDNKLTTMVLVNTNGQVLLRGEDPERFGDSMSSDTLVRRALIGKSVASVTSKDGILAPIIVIKSTVPVRDQTGSIIGAVVASLAVDNTFVDGIKQSTGLDSALYAGNVRSATTFVVPGTSTRQIGIKEANTAITDIVLKQKHIYKGSVAIQNTNYLAVYAPLKDADNTVIGMLFIGQPQTAVQKAAARSIELTFIVTAVLLLLSILPAYLMSRYIASQLS